MPKKKAIDPDTLNAAQRNIAALVASEGLSVNAWATKYRLVQSTINRIVTGRQDPTAGYLHQIAEAVSAKGQQIEAWQLLARDFGEGLFVVNVSKIGETRILPVRGTTATRAPPPAVESQAPADNIMQFGAYQGPERRYRIERVKRGKRATDPKTKKGG